MSQFEYLSVLISMIIGLGIAHLLSSTARLIQRRAQIRPHLPTYCWMAMLFLVNIQIWWVAFQRRTETDWTFFGFLLYLAIPITIFLLSYLVIPDVEDDETVDLRASFQANRVWFFGLFALVPVLSLTDECLRRGGMLSWNTDTVFRLVFIAFSLIAARVRSEGFQAANALFALALFCVYVLRLFLQLH